MNTTKAAHTPGPWEARDHGNRIHGPENELIAGVAQIPSGAREANGRLIAAAPKMLKALERAEKHIACIEGMGSVLTDIRAAIQKARGGR